MKAPERRLWLVLAAIGIAAGGLNAILLRLPWQHRYGGFAVGAFVGLFILIDKPYCRAAFQSLSSVRRTLFIVAAFVTLALVVAIGNWGAPWQFDLDIAEPVGFLCLFMLYLAFSKAMDALWLRFTRR